MKNGKRKVLVSSPRLFTLLSRRAHRSSIWGCGHWSLVNKWQALFFEKRGGSILTTIVFISAWEDHCLPWLTLSLVFSSICCWFVVHHSVLKSLLWLLPHLFSFIILVLNVIYVCVRVCVCARACVLLGSRHSWIKMGVGQAAVEVHAVIWFWAVSECLSAVSRPHVNTPQLVS